MNTEQARERISRIASVHVLTMAVEFVPWSKSRNAAPNALGNGGAPWKSLNWRCRFSKAGREFMTCDYAQGTGLLPGASAGLGRRPTVNEANAVERAIETARWKGQRLSGPSLLDVLASLATDASAIDYARFEDWAGEYGYSEDSRAAEATYRACLEHALALRSAIGDEGLSALREAAACL